MEPDAVEIRVLGCLLEKQRTTPDVYPLSLNALRAACNQATSRDPVVAYDETTVREALQRLAQRRWTRLASASRTTKYRHLLDEALALDRAQLAALTPMLLRGPQTFAELRTRTERLYEFADDDALRGTLDGLAERGLVELLPRQPGQKEPRYRQLLGGEDEAVTSPVAPAAPASGAAPVPAHPDADGDRLDRLEAEVRSLRAELTALRADLGA